MTRSLEASLAGHSPDQWALDFLAAARFAATPSNVRAVVSWEYAESGAGGGMYNPLNTTQGGYPGETDYNGVGVKNFARYRDGIAANARVIRNGFYDEPVRLFELGNDARAICDAITRSPWGTGYIFLRGTVTVPPAPRRPDMGLIASPHRPTIAGRVAAAVWAPDVPNRVTLTNGASIARDVPAGAGKRSWSPPLPPGASGIGITATVGKDGRPDGKGIVMQDDRGDTYIGLWS